MVEAAPAWPRPPVHHATSIGNSQLTPNPLAVQGRVLWVPGGVPPPLIFDEARCADLLGRVDGLAGAR